MPCVQEVKDILGMSRMWSLFFGSVFFPLKVIDSTFMLLCVFKSAAVCRNQAVITALHICNKQSLQ